MVWILWEIRGALSKTFAIEKVPSFLFSEYQKGLFVFQWVIHLWCLMETVFSSVCKLFPPLSFKSTVLIEEHKQSWITVSFISTNTFSSWYGWSLSLKSCAGFLKFHPSVNYWHFLSSSLKLCREHILLLSVPYSESLQWFWILIVLLWKTEISGL